MEYSDVHEMAKKWGVTERRVTLLCRNSRIPFAKKSGKTWLIPSNATLPCDGRTKEAGLEAERDIKSNQTTVEYTSEGADAKVRSQFKKTYMREPENVIFTPYRICPIGAHSDHQLGKITGFTIDKGIYIAYGPKMNGIIEIRSLQFPKRAQWHVMEVPKEKENDWADHLRGATIALFKRYPLRIGLSAVIDGELPIGGLSSSAAVIISYLYALSTINNIKLTKKELITISQEA